MKKKKEMLGDKLYAILYIIIFVLAVIWNVGSEFIIWTTILYVAIFYAIKKGLIASAIKKIKKIKARKFILDVFKKITDDIARKKLQTILLAVILILMIMWKRDAETVILWMLFFSFLLYDWENRIIAGLALVFLASCPFLLIYKKEALAEIMAIYAYYFLVMAVVLQIVELKRHPEEEL